MDVFALWPVVFYKNVAAVSIFPFHKFITGRICLGAEGTGLGTGFIA